MSAEGIKPTDDKYQALIEATPPTNVKELSSLLGVIQSNSRFIRDTCSTTETLWCLTKKNAKWEWTDEHDTALNKLKQTISNKFMAYFNKEWDTELIVDASPVGLGVVLWQRNPRDRYDVKNHLLCVKTA